MPSSRTESGRSCVADASVADDGLPGLREHAPDEWTLVESRSRQPPTAEAESPAGPPGRAAWTYDPRPGLLVRVLPDPDREWPAPTSDGGDGERPRFRYAVEKSWPLGEEHYRAPESDRGFGAHLRVAGEVMRGVAGDLDAERLRVRTGIASGPATALAARVGAWADVAALADRWGDLTVLDGVGQATAAVMDRAIDRGVFDTDPEVAVRNFDEHGDDDRVAVYQLVPHVDGWKVRKQWRTDATLQFAGSGAVWSSVMLPADDPLGTVFDGKRAAREAAMDFALESAGEDDLMEFSHADRKWFEDDLPGRQADLGEWSP